MDRRAMVLGLGALPLAGCGGGGGEARGQRPETATQGTLRAPRLHPPRFGDTDPVDFPHPHPNRFAVHGIDLARFQSHVDWRQAQAGGVNFAFVKATEGGDLLDPNFKAHFHGARAAGVPVGGYHFYYFCRPASEQAAWFIRNVKRVPGDLPPVLDMEWNHTSSCTLRPPPAQVRAEMRVFLNALERHYGTRPVVYTTPDFYAQNDLGSMAGVEFWLRAVTAHPTERSPGERWSFWQYSGTGVVPGVPGTVDMNAFAGSPQAWRNWLASRVQ